MQWSKTKGLFKNRLAESLTGRLDIHCTRYRWTRDEDGRAWVTFDGREVANFCFWTFHNRYWPLAAGIRQVSGTEEYRDLPARDADRAGSEARAILHRQGIFSEDEFLDALRAYLQMSVEDALRSDNPLIRALVTFDRRLGKRRLSALADDARDIEHPVVWRFLALRLEAEGMETTSQSGRDTP
jgi:hypothetical protein